jgi:hypothetical protein
MNFLIVSCTKRIFQIWLNSDINKILKREDLLPFLRCSLAQPFKCSETPLYGTTRNIFIPSLMVLEILKQDIKLEVFYAALHIHC